MNFLLQLIVGMVAMAVVDIPVIVKLINPTLKKHASYLIPKKPDGVAALIFYVGYVALVIILSQQGADTTAEVARNSALLGLFAYGTYEFTNKAVIKDWPWQMVAVDTTWGVILTTIVGTLAYSVS